MSTPVLEDLLIEETVFNEVIPCDEDGCEVTATWRAHLICCDVYGILHCTMHKQFFEKWVADHADDPVHCPTHNIHSFLGDWIRFEPLGKF